MRHVFLLSALGFLFAFYAHAEQVEPLQFIAAPETPGPREQVMIEAQGIGNFLGNADIIWSVDGKAVKRGMGERTFIFTTGALGERTSVRVTIDSETQGFFSRTFTFTPSLVNLVWEADTTVPPLYRGKALYSAGSPLKVVAFPTVYSGSSRVAPSALSYQWERGGESVPEASGLGRYGFSFSGDQLKNAETVGVDVYYGNTKAARGEITISAAEPQVLFYERDPLRGILYEKALPAAISLAGREITLKAEPFYFSSTAKNSGALAYAWMLDGNEVSGPDSASGLLTLRQSGEGRGQGELSVSLQNQNPDMFVQAAQNALQIVFGESSNTLSSFFGL
ncbi:hypothetical protein A2852_01615 [Candidatus Adlerbacteria bacterium RIFCSPHIGHO2_01_FULL_54_23]|nr:MAG: hypothetical protein A2852_01615 [Candidatus Adlerbacteria bacterium RIFCSPHIGHO2_01_FULL_54_23]